MTGPVPIQTLPYRPTQPFQNAIGLPIGTVIDDSFPLAGQGQYGLNLQTTRYGVGGPESQPGQDGIPDAPVTPQTPSGSKLPESPEQKVKSDMLSMFQMLIDQRNYENSPEVMERKNKYALDLMNAIGDKQMELGWKSNLIGFGLKELPRLMTEPGRRRNRYLDDLVLNTPGIQRNAATALTGQGIPNYAMGI